MKRLLPLLLAPFLFSACSESGAYGEDRPALKKVLTPLPYKVAVGNGTEAPLKNEYRDNEELWIYRDIISGEPLPPPDKYQVRNRLAEFYEAGERVRNRRNRRSKIRMGSHRRPLENGRHASRPCLR